MPIFPIVGYMVVYQRSSYQVYRVTTGIRGSVDVVAPAILSAFLVCLVTMCTHASTTWQEHIYIYREREM